jgi:cytochrome b pre-mRNA-processing protein 3
MFKRLFGRENSDTLVDGFYGQIVAAARQPALYAEWNVPDTPLGRYEMIALHLFLFLHRVRGQKGPVAALAQDLTDRLFGELDHSIRELGVGDLGVPKRMKKLVRMFYGRAASYGEALDQRDRKALTVALARNVRPDVSEWPEAAALAAYVEAAHARLAQQDLVGFLAGAIVFPVASEMAAARSSAA